eukprot:6308716-Pyramimonas_sp.AAC.1
MPRQGESVLLASNVECYPSQGMCVEWARWGCVWNALIGLWTVTRMSQARCQKERLRQQRQDAASELNRAAGKPQVAANAEPEVVRKGGYEGPDVRLGIGASVWCGASLPTCLLRVPDASAPGQDVKPAKAVDNAPVECAKDILGAKLVRNLNPHSRDT